MNTNIAPLCHDAFDHFPRDPLSSRVALKSLANTLLLQEQTRQKFVNLGYASKAADRLKVRLSLQQHCSLRVFIL